MSVCQYYLRGNCRYGDRCRLPHGNPNEPRIPYPNNPPFRPRHPRPQIKPEYNYVSSSFNNRNHHVDQTTAPKRQDLKNAAVFEWVAKTFANKEKAIDILIQLQKEARVWQKTEHFWRFTSRSLFPGGEPLEGWQDHSFEELKWAYRMFTSENQEHVYKKNYYDYLTNTERHLTGLATARLETLESLKEYINQYIASDYIPSTTLPATDIEMKDFNDNTTSNFLPSIESTNYTADDQLLENERAAFESDTFEIGEVPVHAPSHQFC